MEFNPIKQEGENHENCFANVDAAGKLISKQPFDLDPDITSKAVDSAVDYIVPIVPILNPIHGTTLHGYPLGHLVSVVSYAHRRDFDATNHSFCGLAYRYSSFARLYNG
jgi:hypothetical protein